MNNRKRILLVEQILKEHTDENRGLTIKEISDLLKEKTGKDEPYRKTIADDIRMLEECGADILTVRSVQNRYHYIGRPLELAELKLLVDAVQSSRFITRKKSNELCKKISSLAGPGAESLKRHTEAENRVKNGNTILFPVIDAIHSAIEQKKQISFYYFRYNEKKEKRMLHGGEPYLFNPAFLVWTGEYYYMVGTYGNHPDQVASFRVDRIDKQPIILNSKKAPMPKKFDLDQYLNGTIHMFGGTDGKAQEISLLCENSTANGIIDRFGLNTVFEEFDEHHFVAKIKTAPTTVFYGWVFGFSGKVKILNPESVAGEYEEMLKKAVEK